MIPVQSLQRHAIVSNPILFYRTARLRVHVNVCMRDKRTVGKRVYSSVHVTDGVI